ncbi:MAG: metallophosphoesterase [Armatimonadota bacterium]
MRIHRTAITAAVALAALILPTTLALALSGSVFVDANSNGIADPGEEAVRGARVSDGAQIALTGADGEYELPDRDEPVVVFITQPTGYTAAAWWQMVQPGHTQSVDFALRPEEQPDGFHFVHVTDIHVKPDVVEHVRHFVRRVNAMTPAPAFVANTGDLVWDLLEAEDEQEVTDAFDLHVSAHEDLRPRHYVIPGNHDHVGYAGELSPDSPLYADGAWKRYFGPPWYSFERAGYLFIALDATLGVTEGDDPPRWGYTDTLRPECLAWLRTELEQVPTDQPIVVLIHEPVHGLTNREDLREAMAGHHVIGVLSGHYHTTARYEDLGATEYVGGALCGGWWQPGPSLDGAPRGYNVVRCIDGEVEVFYQAAVGEHHINLLQPTGEKPHHGAIPIHAQVWDPEGTIQLARAELGGLSAELEVGEGELWRDITGSVKPGALRDGDYRLRVVVQDIGGSEWFAGGTVQLLRKHHSLLRNAGDATLLLSVYHEGGPVEVLVNGRPVGEASGHDSFSEPAELTVPGHLLRYANRVTLVSGTDHDMWVQKLRLKHQGEVHHEPRASDSTIRLNGRKSPHEFVIFLGGPCEG